MFKHLYKSIFGKKPSKRMVLITKINFIVYFLFVSLTSLVLPIIYLTRSKGPLGLTICLPFFIVLFLFLVNRLFNYLIHRYYKKHRKPTEFYKKILLLEMDGKTRKEIGEMIPEKEGIDQMILYELPKNQKLEDIKYKFLTMKSTKEEDEIYKDQVFNSHYKKNTPRTLKGKAIEYLFNKNSFYSRSEGLGNIVNLIMIIVFIVLLFVEITLHIIGLFPILILSGSWFPIFIKHRAYKNINRKDF